MITRLTNAVRGLMLPEARGHPFADPSVERKSGAQQVFAIEGLAPARWSGRDYAAFAREGMMQNPIVYRAIRMIAESASSVPLLLYNGADEIEQHPLLDLLAHPSPHQARADFIEQWLGFLLVSGNAYVEALAVGGEIRELHALRPDRVRVLHDASGWPDGVDYTMAAGTMRLVGEAAPGVRRVLHMKMFHPLHDYMGLAPIEAAATAIDIHNAASRWNKALLDNAARPSGALVYAGGGHLSPDQFDRLKGELESSYTGTRNAGRPLLLEGGLDWKAMSLSPRDMDFIEAKHVAAREIALAMGVPPMLMGIPGDNTYANYQEANRTFWRQTVIPLLVRTTDAIALWLGPAYGGGLRLVPDTDAIDALAADRDAQWARLERATYLTTNEKRAALGYPPIEGGDVF